MDCMETRHLYGDVWISMILYGWLWVGMDISGSISRVYLGIHPNPRFVESWVGKTLVCIRGV